MTWRPGDENDFFVGGGTRQTHDGHCESQQIFFHVSELYFEL
jgi:hypothetical protein